MAEPKTIERRETETDEALADSASAQEEAATVIDDIVKRLNRLSAEMRRATAEQADKPQSWDSLLDGKRR